MLLCIYHLLQPDRRIDEGIYYDEIDQYFSYREWKKKHMNDAERKETKLPRIYDIPLSEIDDFPDHPFKVKLDEDMDQLAEQTKPDHQICGAY